MRFLISLPGITCKYNTDGVTKLPGRGQTEVIVLIKEKPGVIGYPYQKTLIEEGS